MLTSPHYADTTGGKLGQQDDERAVHAGLRDEMRRWESGVVSHTRDEMRFGEGR